MRNFLEDWMENEEYFNALSLMASLSGLFADSKTPYLDYRLAENIFCKFFNAENNARSCTAYDAKIGENGIGIKTFILERQQSFEKIAEFNRLKPQLDDLHGIDLARKLAQFRNDRINFADNTYGTKKRIYHIVSRSDGYLRIFNTGYDLIDENNIEVLRRDNANKGLLFTDGKNQYNFNRSKSVLLKQFCLPDFGIKSIPVKIIKDPLELLLKLFQKQDLIKMDIFYNSLNNNDYVILPLYSTRTKSVPQKSGLNQWNASGRERDENEVYISIPKKIHELHPNFFPERSENFRLRLPDGNLLSAKICQEGGKALMSNPNADLGCWLLRKVLNKKPGVIVTMDDLNRFGIDSVKIVNEHKEDDSGMKLYSISFSNNYENYTDFITEE